MVHLRRRTLYFGFNLLIPCLLITVMAVLGFILPPDAGEKVALEITILLSICFYVTTVVAAIVPPTSEALPLIGIYFMICMILVTISVVFTVFVLNLHHRGALTHKMSSTQRTILLVWLPYLLRIKKRNGNSKDKDQTKNEELVVDKRRKRFMDQNKDCELDMSKPIFNCENFKRTLWEKDTNAYIERTFDLLNRRSNNADTVDTSLLLLTHSIFSEIKFITDRMRREEDIDEARTEWMLAALVVDRLCLIFISALIIASTATVTFASPHAW